MSTQPDLFTLDSTLPSGITEVDQTTLRAHLMSHGWQTRREICAALQWEERKVRDVAESLGTEIVRCQLGFKLTEMVTREDISAVKQAIDAFHSQASKMDQYAHGLRRRLHALVG